MSRFAFPAAELSTQAPAPPMQLGPDQVGAAAMSNAGSTLYVAFHCHVELSGSSSLTKFLMGVPNQKFGARNEEGWKRGRSWRNLSGNNYVN